MKRRGKRKTIVQQIYKNVCQPRLKCFILFIYYKYFVLIVLVMLIFNIISFNIILKRILFKLVLAENNPKVCDVSVVTETFIEFIFVST